jgi:hypothetical protein
MKRTYPIRHPPVPPAARRGEITPAEEEFLSRSEPAAPPESASRAPLPHERDESHHGQVCAEPRQREVGRQAYEDTVGPTEDTDRGPVMDQVYHALVAPLTGTRDRKPPDGRPGG